MGEMKSVKCGQHIRHVLSAWIAQVFVIEVWEKDSGSGSCNVKSCSHTPTTHMAPPNSLLIWEDQIPWRIFWTAVNYLSFGTEVVEIQAWSRSFSDCCISWTDPSFRFFTLWDSCEHLTFWCMMRHKAKSVLVFHDPLALPRVHWYPYWPSVLIGDSTDTTTLNLWGGGVANFSKGLCISWASLGS